MTPPIEGLQFEHWTINVAQLARMCVWVRARLLKLFKSGVIRAHLLAKEKIEVEKQPLEQEWTEQEILDDPSYWMHTFGFVLPKVETSNRIGQIMKQNIISLES